jgi:hypothetical protein
MKINRFSKITAACLLLLFVIVSWVQGADFTIAWDASEGADGYVPLYAPYPDAEYVESVDVGNQTALPVGLEKGNNFFIAVQAYNSYGFNGLSNIVSFVIDDTGVTPTYYPQ